MEFCDLSIKNSAIVSDNCPSLEPSATHIFMATFEKSLMDVFNAKQLLQPNGVWSNYNISNLKKINFARNDFFSSNFANICHLLFTSEIENESETET